jgi:soluble lytic murein transglycosylase-like protein
MHPRTFVLIGIRCAVLLAGLFPLPASAGAQAEEALSASVQASLHQSVSDYPAARLIFASEAEGAAWLNEMSRRLERKMPEPATRHDFLITVQYEAKRAGLDTQMVLGLIELESNFRKFAVSNVGARGFMQVMPFWIKLIGSPDQDLFNLRTNLRYGCTILRFYLDRENGDLFRALGRYNGSLGKPDYPDAVMANWRGHWVWDSRQDGGRRY